MTINQIKSVRIRSVISGSSTPALDIVGLLLRNQLSSAEWVEAENYFYPNGGVRHCATEELNAMRELDI